MQVNNVFDTQQLDDLFCSMTAECWDTIDFAPKTFLNVYIQKPMHDVETIYNGMAAKSSDITWQDRTTVYNFDSGVLYKMYFDAINSSGMVEGDHLWVYAFVHRDIDTIGKQLFEQFETAYPHTRENLWFSYMQTQTYFDWHIDSKDNLWRYHQVIRNDGVTSSFTTPRGDVYAQPNSSFVENASELHCVKPNTSERLHLVGSTTRLPQ
jgi:hypothetical protein